jgi:hypoxanthine-DNA glycosylase
MASKASMHKAVCFPPVVSGTPRKLILGSSPGVKSLQEKQYYAHPQNSFWKIVSKLYQTPVDTYSRRLDLIKKNRLALWDVLESCQRKGSSDAKIDIKTAKVNDFAAFLKKYRQIRHIFFNGTTAKREFERRVLPQLPSNIAGRLSLNLLPSTSPLHTISLKQKIKAWNILLSEDC